MINKCEYCRKEIDDAMEICPYCGATNKNYNPTTNVEKPKTIEELKEWYANNNLPPEETTRFFIGKDYTEPRAFGIYKDEDTGNFIVYKNKDTGVRTTRYEGTDEAYAVGELYDRLVQEIENQKQNQNPGQDSTHKKSILSSIAHIFRSIIWFLTAIICVLGMVMSGAYDSKGQGYYQYDDQYYYYQGYNWYIYNRTSEKWRPVADVPNELRKHKTRYYKSLRYHLSYGIESFKNSGYYDWDYYKNSVFSSDSSSSSRTSSSSSSSSSSGSSWDSGSTDFSSDW